MNIDKVNQKLKQYPLLELAKTTRFIKTKRYIIHPQTYVLGFLSMATLGLNTLHVWATQIARFSGQMISAQALQNRVQFPQVDFCKSLLCQIINRQFNLGSHFTACSLFSSFPRVYLEDSTVIGLPQCLYKYFPGSTNHVKSTSGARIQFSMELKSGKYHSFDLQGYRDNDQKHAIAIINKVARGDLLIRDLGYFVVEVFKKMLERGIFFLSRYKYNTNVYDLEHQKIELAQVLRTNRKRQIMVLDRQVLLGKDKKVPVRLVAIKAPPQVEQKRKRKANRDRRSNHSDDYMELLGWTIFITNVEVETWSFEQLFKAYGFRWRIEIIFKCWKRNFDINKLLKHKCSMSLPRAQITVYLMLVAVTLLFVNAYSKAMLKVYERTGKVLSLIKFGDYLKITQADPDDEISDQDIKLLARYYCQNKRKTKSHMELMYLINLS